MTNAWGDSIQRVMQAPFQVPVGTEQPCPYCDDYHPATVCKRIKQVVFDKWGTVSSIEFHEPKEGG